MLGNFLQPNATAAIAAMNLPDDITRHCAEVIFKGYTIFRNAIPAADCARLVEEFHAFEAENADIFAENRDRTGHYPRIVNLHLAFPQLLALFTRNTKHLAVSDVLFGGRTSLYTSLFYQTGSEQSLHRDSPMFCTRPEYLYFGNTVYLEAADDGNGCLEVVERGHLLGELDREQIAREHYGSLGNVKAIDSELWNRYQDRLVEQCHQRGLVTKKLYMQAGDSLIWHPQLPHGGSPIMDRSRTRLSLVTHTTPVGVPVYHQDAFFRPGTPYPTTPQWNYIEIDGRKIVDHQGGVSFGHVRDYPLSAFRRAQPPKRRA